MSANSPSMGSKPVQESGSAPLREFVESDLSWVNSLLEGMWPKTNAAFKGFVDDVVTPWLQERMPRLLKVSFPRVILGQQTPEFGNIEVRTISETQVQLEVGIKYHSDVDVLVEVGRIRVGVNHLQFEGKLCVALTPLMDVTPVIGGMQIHFINEPLVQLNFAGLGALAEQAGATEFLLSGIKEYLRSNFVLPNGVFRHFGRRDEDKMAAFRHHPIAVLRVRALRARSLAGANWTFRSASHWTSNPFVQFSLGGDTQDTGTAYGTTEPEWCGRDQVAYLVVYHIDQLLGATVLSRRPGKDWLHRLLMNSSVPLGKLRDGITLRDLFTQWRCDPPDDQKCDSLSLPAAALQRELPAGPCQATLQLDTTMVNRNWLHVDDPMQHETASELTLEAARLDILEVPQSQSLPKRQANDDHGAYLVSLELFAAFCLPRTTESRRGYRWHCRVDEGKPKVSKMGEVMYKPRALDEVRLDPDLFPVITRFEERGLHDAEIAELCDTTVEVIRNYKSVRRSEEEDRMKKMQRFEAPTSDAQWFQTLLFVTEEMDTALLHVSLFHGKDRVGDLEPITLGLLRDTTDWTLPRNRHHLVPAPLVPQQGLRRTLFAACSEPVVDSRSPYNKVELEFTVRLNPLGVSESGTPVHAIDPKRT